MPSCSPARWITRAIVVGLVGQPLWLAAQTPHRHDPDSAVASAMESPGEPGGKRHVEFTSLRPGTTADTARALAMVQRLRESIAPYADVEAAEAAGYRMRPGMEMPPGKALVHMGNPRVKHDQDPAFDPRRPQALLYRRAPGGELTLAGAMFTAPGSASVEELDAWVPLSVSRWHKHVNVCLPRGAGQRGPELRRAATPDACAKAGGRFRAESARYMVHVMTDAGGDLSRIFPQGQEHPRAGRLRHEALRAPAPISQLSIPQLQDPLPTPSQPREFKPTRVRADT